MNDRKRAVFMFAILGCGLLAFVVKTGGLKSQNGQPVQTQIEEGQAQKETAPPEPTTPAYEYEVRVLPGPQYQEPAEHFAGGSGIAQDPYQIADASQLALMSVRINDIEANKTYGSACYVLTEDIILNDVSDFEDWAEKGPQYSWKPAGDGTAALTFSGNFNGNGHVIRGLYINENNDDDPYARAYGLFGSVSGTVQDLTLEQSYIAVSGHTAEVGAIAGILTDSGVIDNCTSEVVMETYDAYCGGIVGRMEGGYVVGKTYEEGELPTYSVVRNCRFSGTIEQKKNDTFSYLGGIAGIGDGHIVSCTNKGTIRFGSSDLDSAGGLVGMLEDGMIAGCENAGTLECRMETSDVSADVGGIAGTLFLSSAGSETDMSQGILVRNCKNTGTVSGKGYVGGIVGRMDCSGDSDYGSNITIQNCSNESDLTAGNVGGIIGYFTSASGAVVIRNCDNKGDLTAEAQNAAGIIAHWMMDEEPDIRILIEQCDNSGDVVSGLHAGGLFGFVDQPVVLSEPKKTAVVIQECKNSGSVKTTKQNGFIGGIAGNVGLKDMPVVFSSCHNSGDLIMEHEAGDLKTRTEKKAVPIFRIAGGIVGRIGSGFLLPADTDEGTEADLQKSSAKIAFAGCKNTGTLHVTEAEETENTHGETIYKNWFGGIIGYFCGKDGYAVLADSCSYQNFERGLGNEEYPDVGEKLD